MNEGANILKGRNNNQLVLDKNGGVTVSTGTSFLLINSPNIPQPPVTTPSSETSNFTIPKLGITGSVTGAKDIIPLFYPTESVPKPSTELITDTSSFLLPETEFLFSTEINEDYKFNDPNIIDIGEVIAEGPPSNFTGGAVTTDADYKDRKGTPRQIILHIVDGKGTGQSIVSWVNRKNPRGTQYPNVFGYYPDGTPKWGGIHWAIGEQGDLQKGISETKYAIHAESWNTYGIGIEIAGAFYYEKQATRYYSPSLGYQYPLNTDRVVDLGYTYNGTRYTQEYTDGQINTLRQLIKDILSRYPEIKQGITGNVWKVFGLSGKPTPGGTYTSSKYTNSTQYGIFAHSTAIGATHTDPQPTRKLINLLKEFGYTE
jgi:hypothetical protein